MTTNNEISHGRGGAGNINPDNTEYVDGEIVRQGTVGPHGDGAYSTGRGGSANIADKNKATPLSSGPTGPRGDKEYVPQAAVRPSVDGDFHTGRGGAANVARSTEPAAAMSMSMATATTAATTTTVTASATASTTATAVPASSSSGPEHTTAAVRSNGTVVRHQGLADKLKYKLFRVFKK
ncbi:hypothetical protein GGR50DRAFT_644627 [Xylaria sp. CBS 124048]|nr:hypothetical protein GGR50DRAFT_644627 [Xylaria sp. CBS 124048]